MRVAIPISVARAAKALVKLARPLIKIAFGVVAKLIAEAVAKEMWWASSRDQAVVELLVERRIARLHGCACIFD